MSHLLPFTAASFLAALTVKRNHHLQKQEELRL